MAVLEGDLAKAEELATQALNFGLETDRRTPSSFTAHSSSTSVSAKVDSGNC